MGWFSSVGLAMSTAASAVSSIFTDYKKYGSVYRVLEINSSEADRSLGIGENLEASLRELPDVNVTHLNQFLEKPLNNIFTLYNDQKELIHEKEHLEHYINHLKMYESLLNQGDTTQEGNIQSTQTTINEYQNRIINRESNIMNNPINKLLDHK